MPIVHTNADRIAGNIMKETIVLQYEDVKEEVTMKNDSKFILLLFSSTFCPRKFASAFLLLSAWSLKILLSPF